MLSRFLICCFFLSSVVAAIGTSAFAASPSDLFRDLREKLDREAMEGALEKGPVPTDSRETGPADEEGWIQLSSKDGGFEILFSGIPAYKRTLKDTRVGEVEENLFELSTDDGDFAVEYTDLPGIAVLLGGTKAILRKVKGELLKNEKGRELEYFRMEQDDERGAELAYRTKTRLGRARLFLVDKRLYVVVASVDEARGDRRVINKFLDSFSFLKRKFQRKPHKYIDIQQDTLLQ